ncbi:MAG TPA: alpha/beta hydrolase [Nevskiaceae bacterium]|nr:alpha/beta hydrolase [Nevskiaceae bacterium]
MTSSSPIPVGHFVDIDPVAGAPQRVHYEEQGEGEVVIFLHGAGAGASGYSNFKGNYPEFAKAGYHCIVPDLLGYGLSSKPDIEQYDLDFFIAGVKGLVDKLGVQDLTLLGNSLGGAVALGYALAYPAEVKRLILMAPGGVEDLETYFQQPGIINMFEVYKTGVSGIDAMRKIMRMLVFKPESLTEEIIHERAPIAPTQTNAARSVLKVPNMTQRLCEIKCPIFGFWGVNDAFNPVGGAMKIVEHAPDARIELVNQCGHWVQVEHRDMFNRLCIDFLKHS